MSTDMLKLLREGGAISLDELESAFTNMSREYDKRGDRIKELEGVEAYADALEKSLSQAVKALRECEAEIDGHIWYEYPGYHPVHERYRKRDFDSNPARIAIKAIEGDAE